MPIKRIVPAAPRRSGTVKSDRTESTAALVPPSPARAIHRPHDTEAVTKARAAVNEAADWYEAARVVYADAGERLNAAQQALHVAQEGGK